MAAKGEPVEPIEPVVDEKTETVDPSADVVEAAEAVDNKVVVESVPPTTVGTYIFVGMMFFVLVMSIVFLPYINGMMISVYFFILFIMLVVMHMENQFVRTSIMIQLSITYFLLFLFKTAEYMGTSRLYNIDTLIRGVIITTFIGMVPFLLPGTIDFVKYVTTREI